VPRSGQPCPEKTGRRLGTTAHRSSWWTSATRARIGTSRLTYSLGTPNTDPQRVRGGCFRLFSMRQKRPMRITVAADWTLELPREEVHTYATVTHLPRSRETSIGLYGRYRYVLEWCISRVSTIRWAQFQDTPDRYTHTYVAISTPKPSVAKRRSCPMTSTTKR
jgi:hypothetical protein